jgi:hypothetical protein
VNYPTKIQGIVEAALVCDDPISLVSSRKDKVIVQLAGINGDRHFGYTFPSNGRYPMYPRGTEINNSRQVSIISVEEVGVTASELGLSELLPEWYGANLYLKGIPALTFLPPGTRLTFENGPVLIVQGENEPCINVGRILQEQHPDRARLDTDFVKAAVRKRGVVAWIEHPGFIGPGDKVSADIPNYIDYTQNLR